MPKPEIEPCWWCGELPLTTDHRGQPIPNVVYYDFETRPCNPARTACQVQCTNLRCEAVGPTARTERGAVRAWNGGTNRKRG